jgi:UrcA family protein
VWLAVLTASPAEFAQSDARGVRSASMSVRYPSTDLDSPPAVGRLYRRITAAAGSVCGPYDDALSEEKLAWNACVDRTVQAAVLSVHSDKLTAYHLRRIGRRDGATALAAR